jgi:hypothetical protein
MSIDDNTNQDEDIQDNCWYIVHKSLRIKNKVLNLNEAEEFHPYFIIFIVEISICT